MTRRRSPAAKADEPLGRLFDETVRLYLRLTADATLIHRDGPLSGPRRTVLVGLARSGPQTVATMARVRAQSRQRFQPLVNRLIEDGLVVARSNPAHRQSPLIALTPEGESTVRQIVETERRLRAGFKMPVSTRALTRSAVVLRSVREALEAQLPALLASDARRKRKR
jgi:DNA-binding MarR family transcriptional regulator